MKIKYISIWDAEGDDSADKEMKSLIDEGNIIIDFGYISDSKGEPKGVFIKYCDKQFLRDYKINSIMSEL